MDNDNKLPGFLEGLFDKALGVFDRIADIEVAKRELKVQRDFQLFSQAQAFEGQQPASFAGSGQIIAGVSNTTLLIAGGLGIVGLVLLTR